MARLLVMYKTPKDPAAFNRHYFDKHVPLANTIPGVRKYEISNGPIATPTGPAAIHLVAILHFDDMAAIQRAFASPEGHAAAADVQSFATGGVEMYLFDDKQV